VLIIIHTEAEIFVYRKGSIEPWYPWGFKVEPTLSQYYTDVENINDVNLIISSLICPQPKYASYYLDRELQDISDCTTFSLCNSTLCVYYGPAAVAFGLKFSTTRGNNANITKPCYAFQNEHDKVDDCEPIIVRRGTVGNLVRSDWNRGLHNEVNLDTIFSRMRPPLGDRVQKVLQLNAHLLQRFFNTKCQVNQSEIVIIEQSGNLPIGCFKTYLYNSTSMIHFNLAPQLLLESWSPRTDLCQPFLDETTNISEILNSNATRIPFNLPGYRYDET
jgi:hypothetical protein